MLTGLICWLNRFRQKIRDQIIAAAPEYHRSAMGLLKISAEAEEMAMIVMLAAAYWQRMSIMTWIVDRIDRLMQK